MTIGKKNIPVTEMLLGVITFCVGIIMWFFYGVVGDVEEVVHVVQDMKYENQEQHFSLTTKLNAFMYSQEMTNTRIDSNTYRSLDNAGRLNIVERKVGLY